VDSSPGLWEKRKVKSERNIAFIFFLMIFWLGKNTVTIFLKFYRICEGDPLSPPEGEADQAEHPLDPHPFLISAVSPSSPRQSPEWQLIFLMPHRRIGYENG
jgi:hypothetical protein